MTLWSLTMLTANKERDETSDTALQGIKDRQEGSWLGQMSGDALGSQVEFDSPERLQRRYPNGLRDLGGSSIWGTAAGQVTDDTEMAIELMHALIESDGMINWNRVAQGYVRWYQSHPFDSGDTVRRAVSGAVANIEEPDHVADAMRQSANYDSKANGALMRQSPLAIWGYGLEPAVLGQVAGEDARLTHPNPVCREASAVYVTTIAEAIRTGLDAEASYQFAMEYHQKFGQEDDVLGCLEKARTMAPPYSHHIGYVLVALHNAFYQLLHTADFEGAVVSTVMIGGDTDTNGAIAGALAGAVYGKNAVPQRWIETLMNCESSPGRPRPSRYLPRSAWETFETLVNRV